MLEGILVIEACMFTGEDCMSSESNAPNTRQRNTSFLNVFRTIFHHLVLFTITFVVVVAASIVVSVLTPPKYTSESQLFATFNEVDSQNDNYTAINNANSYITNQIKSYPTLATTDVVLNPVINQLHLDMSGEELADKLTVTNPQNTAFINIRVVDQDAQTAKNIAEAVSGSLSNVVEHSLYSDVKTSPVKITVVQSATIPTTPSSPNIPLNIIVGILCGLALGAIVALLKDVLSTKIETEEEIGQYIDAPIIGRIAENKSLDDATPAVINEPGSPIAEDFRRIRTNLSFIAPVANTQCHLIVITSTGASEGKTTNSVNIAAALAENGARVLLIDADLRHPSIAKKLDLDESAGLVHVLSGQASVKDVIQRYWKPNLHIMPAGPKPPNASALLNSPVMSELLRNAMRQYDYVLIDTAPMIVANDAAIFLRQGGALVMVVRRGQTQKHDIQEIADELNTLDMSASGVVFNCVKENKKAIENSNYYYYFSLSATNEKKK